MLAQVLGEADLARVRIGAGDERRVGDGYLMDQVHEAGVAIGGALVEGVFADHVGGGQEEQLRLSVAHERGAALVGEGALGQAADGRGQVGAQRTTLGARELGHLSIPFLCCWYCCVCGAVVVRSVDWVDELVADSNGLPEGASPKK